MINAGKRGAEHKAPATGRTRQQRTKQRRWNIDHPDLAPAELAGLTDLAKDSTCFPLRSDKHQSSAVTQPPGGPPAVREAWDTCITVYGHLRPVPGCTGPRRLQRRYQQLGISTTKGV